MEWFVGTYSSMATNRNPSAPAQGPKSKPASDATDKTTSYSPASALEENQIQDLSPPLATVMVSKFMEYPASKDKKHMASAQLDMQLEVRTDDDFQSRLWCNSTFFLTLPDSPFKRELATTVYYSLLMKPSHCIPDGNGVLSRWARDWITCDMRRDRRYEDHTAKELVWAVRTLYNKNGTVKNEGRSGQVAGPLYGPGENDTLIFISKIMTKAPFAGKGLLKHVVDLLFQGITHTHLPDRCRISGPVCWVLEPGFITDESGEAVWPKLHNETDDERCRRVIAILKDKIYPKVGFSIYRTDVIGGKHTVHDYLGRRVYAHPPESGAVVGRIEDLNSQCSNPTAAVNKATGKDKSRSRSKPTSEHHASSLSKFAAQERRRLIHRQTASTSLRTPNRLHHSAFLRPANKSLEKSNRHEQASQHRDSQLARNVPRSSLDGWNEDDENSYEVVHAFSTLSNSIRDAHSRLSDHDWKWLYQSIMQLDELGTPTMVPSTSTPGFRARVVLHLFHRKMGVIPDGKKRLQLLEQLAQLDATPRPPSRSPARPAPPTQANAHFVVVKHDSPSIKREDSDDGKPVSTKPAQASRGDRKHKLKVEEDEDSQDNEEDKRQARKCKKLDQKPFATQRRLRSNHNPEVKIATEWAEKGIGSVWHIAK